MGVDPPCRQGVGATQVARLECYPTSVTLPFIPFGGYCVERHLRTGTGRGCTRSPYGSRPTSSHASRTTSYPSATSTHSTKRPAGSDGAPSTWARRSCSRCQLCLRLHSRGRHNSQYSRTRGRWLGLAHGYRQPWLLTRGIRSPHAVSAHPNPPRFGYNKGVSASWDRSVQRSTNGGIGSLRWSNCQ